MPDGYRERLQKNLEQGALEGLKPEDKFNFACPQDCMGRCCTNITIFLDPWDVETMARHLGISCREFLDNYCAYGMDRHTRWPVVNLSHAARGQCAFMLSDGRCSIYPVRSRNCRTYPIGRAVRFEREGDGVRKEDRLFMVDRAAFCFGHSADKSWTVREWLDDSNAGEYYDLSDLYLELVHYAQESLHSREWMSESMGQMLAPLIFGPDILRAKLRIAEEDMDHREFYRRRLKAVRAVLTDMAAGFGFGPPAADRTGPGAGGSMMERVREILLRG